MKVTTNEYTGCAGYLAYAKSQLSQWDPENPHKVNAQVLLRLLSDVWRAYIYSRDEERRLEERAERRRNAHRIKPMTPERLDEIIAATDSLNVDNMQSDLIQELFGVVKPADLFELVDEVVRLKAQENKVAAHARQQILQHLHEDYLHRDELLERIAREGIDTATAHHALLDLSLQGVVECFYNYYQLSKKGEDGQKGYSIPKRCVHGYYKCCGKWA